MGDDCSIHFHQNVELIHVFSGCLDITVRGETARLSAGDFAIASCYEPHGFLTVESSDFEVIIFPADLIPDYVAQAETRMLTSPFLKASPEADKIAAFVDMLRPYTNRPITLTATGLSYTILGSFVEALNLVPKIKNTKADTVLTKMLTYVNDHFKEELTLIDLANHLGYHKSYLSEIFNKGVGYSFNRYLNMLRARYAYRLIRQSAMSLDEISLASGFQCTRSFRRAFVEYYNMTPHEYRQFLQEASGQSRHS